MTAVDLDALEAALAAATPGPWAVAATGGVDALTQDGWREVVIDFSDPLAEADAALIVAAVNAIPDLIAAVRRVEALAAERAAAELERAGRGGYFTRDGQAWAAERAAALRTRS